MHAARYLGVPPWDLAEQSSVWLRWALTMERAEGEAAQWRAEQVQKRRMTRP